LKKKKGAWHFFAPFFGQKSTLFYVFFLRIERVVEEFMIQKPSILDKKKRAKIVIFGVFFVRIERVLEEFLTKNEGF